MNEEERANERLRRSRRSVGGIGEDSPTRKDARCHGCHSPRFAANAPARLTPSADHLVRRWASQRSALPLRCTDKSRYYLLVNTMSYIREHGIFEERHPRPLRTQLVREQLVTSSRYSHEELATIPSSYNFFEPPRAADRSVPRRGYFPSFAWPIPTSPATAHP